MFEDDLTEAIKTAKNSKVEYEKVAQEQEEKEIADFIEAAKKEIVSLISRSLHMQPARICLKYQIGKVPFKNGIIKNSKYGKIISDLCEKNNILLTTVVDYDYQQIPNFTVHFLALDMETLLSRL